MIDIKFTVMNAIENAIQELAEKGYSKIDIQEFVEGLKEELENIDYDYLEVGEE